MLFNEYIINLKTNYILRRGKYNVKRASSSITVQACDMADILLTERNSELRSHSHEQGRIWRGQVERVPNFRRVMYIVLGI